MCKEGSVRSSSSTFLKLSDASRTTITMGRGIRRLVSLFEPIDAIVAEADYHLQVEKDGSQFPQPYTDDQVEAKRS